MSDVKRNPEFEKEIDRLTELGIQGLRDAAELSEEEFLKKHPRLDYRNRKRPAQEQKPDPNP